MPSLLRPAYVLFAALLLALSAAAPAQQPPAAARAISITAPAADETIHSNSGDVSVAVTVAPRLARGESIVISLDGRDVARGADQTVPLAGVVRGTHALQARLVDAQGDVLAQSGEVTFHMWQASRLFPTRKK
jgi:hypothetical protein